MQISRAQAVVDGFAGKRIIVIGDVMLDEYIWGAVSRISPEAPVMVVEAGEQTHVPGGAANVVNNLCALGATGLMLGIVGDDEAGRKLADALRAEGADVSGLVSQSERPTTRKTRVIAHSQQVLRIDHEVGSPIDPATAARLASVLEAQIVASDGVLLSDYQKGVLVPELLRAAVHAARTHRKTLTGNLKPIALNGDCRLGVLTLNLSEAAQAVNRGRIESDADVTQAGCEILEKTGADNVLITRGGQGMTLVPASDPERPIHLPPHRVAVYDAAGAGDTVISVLTLALAAGATAVEAMTLANCAAAEAVKKVGVATVSREEIIAGLTPS